jgi:plasmid stabilization system protein ParE
MKIFETKKFKKEIKTIALYIKKDKPGVSIEFVSALKEQINDLVNFPYKYRKSIYFDDENIRDMIFRGYTIIYEVKENSIEVISIFNQNKPLS